MKVVHVAAAAIIGVDGRLLISRRHDHAHQGGLWEFPGGKVEAGESVQQALCRELDEELGIQPQSYRPLIKIPFDYPDKRVLLDVWLVSGFSGQPEGREGQPLRWVARSSLSADEFPPANRPIITALQLPETYAITGEFATPDQLERRTAVAIERGAGMIQLRLAEPARKALKEAIDRIGPVCRLRQVPLIINASLTTPLNDDCAGIYLNRHALRQTDSKAIAGWRQCYPGKWIGASCHDREELELAARLGVDYASFSPVLPTASHPGSLGTGWDAFRDEVANVPFPVYALGGVGSDDLSKAFDAGAQGIAGIGAFWKDG